MANLLQPGFADYGLVAVAASVLIMVLLVPILLNPGLDRQLDERYAAWDSDAMPDAAHWAWDTSITSKSLGDTFAAEKKPPKTSQLAFRYGVREGLEKLAINASRWQPFIDQLPVDAGICDPADNTCHEVQQLMNLTGRWALISYLDCQRGIKNIENAQATLKELSC